MKKVLRITLLFALMALIAGCSKEKNQQEKQDATMKIVVTGDMMKGSDSPTLTNENNIFGYSVLVYEGGILEKVESFTSGLTKTITGLTTGMKRVVVLANLPASYALPVVGDPYTNLATQNINLDDQSGWTNGLVMSGESSIMLQPAPQTNEVTIKIRRIVAKIMLENLTVNAPAGQTGQFDIQSVYITKAKSLSNVGIPATSPIVTQIPYYGGYTSLVTKIQKPYLVENITTTDFKRYFYVFANDNAEGHATILGIRAMYEGRLSYFPFVINNGSGTGGDGEFIKPNHQYKLEITINNPATGTPNPEKPSEPADLTVTITPENWTIVPTQQVEW